MSCSTAETSRQQLRIIRTKSPIDAIHSHSVPFTNRTGRRFKNERRISPTALAARKVSTETSYAVGTPPPLFSSLLASLMEPSASISHHPMATMSKTTTSAIERGSIDGRSPPWAIHCSTSGRQSGHGWSESGAKCCWLTDQSLTETCFSQLSDAQ